jgi:formylglycine-generating enzyme required for sulfatase activity
MEAYIACHKEAIKAREGSVGVDAIALEGLGSDSYRTRAAAVAALGELGEQFAEAIVEMLADDYPQVRVAAIHALEGLRPDGEWRAHLKYECYVPAGEFIMGEGKRAHSVYLDAFYIGRYPVTKADYKRYMDDYERSYDIPGGKADHPVVGISWYDARDYAVWAGMRLLTEAEWEKAASWDEEGRPGLLGEKQGRKRKYPWGDAFDKYKCNTFESGIGGTSPVGQFSPQGDSTYGCADMTGNVWEWTSSLDWDYPYKADDGREVPHSSDRRVLRGSAFNRCEDYARSASRHLYGPSGRYAYGGFRVGVAALFSPRSGL